MRLQLKWPAILLAVITLSTTATTPITVSAASYHNGMPKKFWGHWQSNGGKMRVSKTGYELKAKGATGWPFAYGKPKVKSIGHNKYKVKIFTYQSNCWTTATFSYVSKNKIRAYGSTYTRY